MSECFSSDHLGRPGYDRVVIVVDLTDLDRDLDSSLSHDALRHDVITA